MSTVTLTAALREEYARLFDTCMPDPAKMGAVNYCAKAVRDARARYESVGVPLGIPWYFIGVTHCMESSFRFDRHLHNGDPLTARTVQVPKARPRSGSPPFTWEESASDALTLKKLHRWQDWSIPGLLFQLEAYNGFGYRRFHPEVLSPYLWSFSNHYTQGKYVADGTWSPTAKSKQCGAAVILRRLAEIGAIDFTRDGQPLPGEAPAPRGPRELEPLVRFSKTRSSEAARQLQIALNRFPGVFLLVDGVPGPRTSDACKKVLGYYLAGDPRAA